MSASRDSRRGIARLGTRARAATTQLVLRGRQLLLIDVVSVAAAFVASFALRFDAPSATFSEYIRDFAWALPILIVIRIGAFIGFGLYQRVWRYASVDEMRAIIAATTLSAVIAYSGVYLAGAFDPHLGGFPRSIAIIESLLTTALIGGTRFGLLILGLGRRGGSEAAGSRALIVGAGAAGVNVARELMRDTDLGMTPVGFIDDHETPGHRILGLQVLGRLHDLGAIVRERGVGTVLFALPHADGPTLRGLVRLAERESARSLTVPSMSEVLTGQVRTGVREIQMDDLLRRAPARTDLDAIRGSIEGRDVLVTGAGGSIGSELSRQLLAYEPRRLILLGRGENSIYELLETVLVEARDRFRTELVPVIMDVRDEAAVASLFRTVSPHIVFHAAAHKHVGFMELYPVEALATNVIGTRNVISACERSAVSRFVFVSTDKAVRPTSVMGASKRIGELLVRAAAERTGRPFVCVRFGNVLSSRGSVVPRFRRQLAAGGPLTVTHPQVRRYFMTVSEAVQLILQAMVLGRSGETFVLDMGAPVLIAELARDLIELHGMKPERDVKIVYTGLGPGEKLDEELFFPHERPERTVHDSIWVAADGHAQLVDADIVTLESAWRTGDGDEVIRALRQIVPEYVPASASSRAVRPTTFEGAEGA